MGEFNVKNYRINRILDQYKYLGEEIKTRNNLKKKYTGLSNILLGTEIFLITLELGLVGSTIALPVITPVSAPIVVALTTCSTVSKSVGRLVARKISKHSEIAVLARSKRSSLEEKFNKTINDEIVTDEEFYDIIQEIQNYENMKQGIQNEYKFTGVNIKKQQ
jgi:hypothetical protein